MNRSLQEALKKREVKALFLSVISKVLKEEGYTERIISYEQALLLVN